jgi:hypothetical protein
VEGGETGKSKIWWGGRQIGSKYFHMYENRIMKPVLKNKKKRFTVFILIAHC